ncbi:hypothetical protein F1645_10925 [Novacetimonas hansenii]|uniref:Uncharacterized protein n=2 Tax=Novacetimonas hansenii TaxID=436 RepID=A0ABQ0SJN8_NOVHA|nr:hypothetical protein [Novacetimonas hansenii]EFG85954.1 hypothetical protein GXY_00184 [Novacetimonas hansenii ATCC 23769]GAN82808.1 hypothetical protein Gaha_0044_005 [Novacetimonas hansenii JCM 7643]GBQ52604.1 hypothetical protein AA0243_0079 [Novacetimonas hansenii NRIC 0243]GEC65150.1 hypothetical protein GHA01_29990 [Novacetimonas hansenii]
MISGATRGKGGSGLWRHLLDYKRQNDAVMVGASRGLIETGTKDQIKELTHIGSYASHSKPLHHVHADPAKDWTPDQWADFWKSYENEFSLQKQPFTEVVHVKHGREHKHRVYSLLLSSGSCIRMDNDFIRREKLNRLAEIRTGEPILSGRHNDAVIKALDAEGKTAQAQLLRDAGLEGIRTRGKLKPQERAQQERTHIDKAGLAVIILKGWKSFVPTVLMEQLKAHGCSLAMGNKGPVVIDQTGNVHALNRLVNMASKAEGKPLKITAKQAVNYVRGYDLPFYADIQKKGKTNDRTIPELGTGQEDYFIPADLSGSLWSEQKHTGHTRPDEQPDRRQTLTHRPDTAVARNHRIATGSNPVSTKPDIEKIVSTGKLNRGVTHVARLSHVVLITPDYIRDIKARLKQAREEDWYFYRRAYQNLKDQQYWLDQWNNSIDSNILLLLVELFLSLFFGGSVTIRNKPYPIAINFGLPAPISDATWNMMSEDQQENILFESYLLYKASYGNYQKLHAQQNRIPITFEFFLNLHEKDILTRMISRNVDYLEDKAIDREKRGMDAENAKILQDTNDHMTWMKQNNSDVENHGNTLKM